MTLGICPGGVVQKISLSERDLAHGGDWEVVWEATGSGSLDAEATLVVGEDSSLITTTYSQPVHPEAGYQFDLTVIRSEQPPRYLVATFDPLPETVDPAKWIQADGSQTDGICG